MLKIKSKCGFLFIDDLLAQKGKLVAKEGTLTLTNVKTFYQKFRNKIMPIGQNHVGKNEMVKCVSYLKSYI